MNNSILLPPSNQFWTQCARQLIQMMPAGTVDFFAYRVIVPAFEHAHLLMSAMSEELGCCFIAPRINTLSAWLSMQITEGPAPLTEGERIMSLYGQLREHSWLKKIFTARQNIDLLPLAQTLITLSDELTEAMLPLILEKGVEATAHVFDTLTQHQVLSEEAQLVWQIWTSQLDGQDPINLRFQQMQRLAKNATDALLWISPVLPEGLDQQFLTTYAKKNPVQIISLDWRAPNLTDTYCTAWPEIIDLFRNCSERSSVELGRTAATGVYVVVHKDCEEHPTSTDGRAVSFERDLMEAGALSNISDPLHHITTIAADNLEQEAQLAAQTIVNWLQQGKSRLALIAQDRVAARRIRALLERAQVYVSDETGWKLSTTRAAAALASWFEVVATHADTVLLLDLLKSPYFEPEQMQGYAEKSTWVMTIELALRQANTLGGWEAILFALQGTSSACVTLVEQLKNTARRYSERRNLTQWYEIIQQTLAEFGILKHWQQDEAGVQVIQLLEKLGEDSASVTESFSFSEWRTFINLQLENTAFQANKIDARVVMLPLNGARLRSFDAVLVVGCDASHLPSQSQEVLFFTNKVRRECGLITREQRQRQQLRDFTELLSANPEVVLSYQHLKRGEDNPISPWIERLNLCLQRAGFNRLKERNTQLSIQTLPVIPSKQPRPSAASLAPRTLSASGYNSFLACPYQFFATRLLGLSSLDTLSDLPEKRDYGGWIHAILKTYHDTLKAQPELYPNEKHETLLRNISDLMFNEILQKNPAALGYCLRWQKVIPAYVIWSQQRIAEGWQFEMGEVWLEKKLEWGEGSITLRGQIDRIDKNRSGEFAVLDYKTSPLSNLKSKLSGLEDQQLPFYGLLTEEKTPISSAHYVALELTREKIADVAAPDYIDWQEKLKEAIVQNMKAIQQGALLPAQGVSQVCQYCEVRGLCRKGAW